MTLQVMRLGELLLVTVPGEITTVMGQRVAQACSTVADSMPGIRHITIVSLANQYMSYFTTPEEYNAQHYEGAHTIWGPHAGEFVGDELADLVEQLIRGESDTFPDKWTFSPGGFYRFTPFCFKPRSPLLVDTVLIDTTLPGKDRVSIYWWDHPAKFVDLTALHWRIETRNGDGSWRTYRVEGLAGVKSMPVDDMGFDLIIAECKTELKKIIHCLGLEKSREKNQRSLWQVSWYPSESPPPYFRFALYDRPSGQVVLAREVYLNADNGP